MVFFNDPLPMPNHPEQAVRMALAMRDRVFRLQDDWKPDNRIRSQPGMFGHNRYLDSILHLCLY